MNSESDRERDASRSEHRQQRPHPLHQPNAKPSSSMMRPINHAGLLSGDPSNPYAVAAALAMAASEDNGGFHRQSPFLGGEGSTPPPPDNAALLALYHSPLWQAAIRQQQLQIINHLANIGNPFMSAQGLAPSGSPMTIPPLSPFQPSFGPGSAYSDYIAKYAKAQQTTTTSTSSSPTITSPKLLTPTSGSTNTTSAQAAVAARLAANLMAVAGKPPSSSSSPDYTPSISTTSNILSNAADSRAGSQSLRYGLDKLDPLRSPSSLLSTSLGMERKDNNNGKHLLRNDSPPTVPTSIAPIAQSIIGAGRGSGQRGSSGRGRGRGISSHPGSTSDGLNGRDKVFTCKICNRSFGYKHVLQNHERTHTGEKPFECRVCHKRFTRDHHLKTHMRLHTGEKPYNCTHCDRQFVQVANLRRHLRVHTGEKPYKCDLCDSTFSDSNQLKAHILIHKGEKPFTCEKCEGKFRRRHHLMHHACPMGSHGLAEPIYNYDDDDDGESLTSPSSDSMRRSRGSYEDSEFSFPSKKFRSLSSPHYDPELDKKLLRCELPSPSSKVPSGLELSLMLAAAAENEKLALSGGLSNVSSRSRKSRDPKRVRPSADHSPKSDGSSDTQSGKILTSSTFESDTERNVVREKSFERSFQTEPEDLSSSRRQADREDDLEEDEKENMDDLDVSTSSDRVSATATVSSTTDPTSLNNHTTLLNKVPIVN